MTNGIFVLFVLFLPSGHGNWVSRVNEQSKGIRERPKSDDRNTRCGILIIKSKDSKKFKFQVQRCVNASARLHKFYKVRDAQFLQVAANKTSRNMYIFWG